MNIRILTIAMMAMMLTAGPAMAMDSPHQDKHTKTLSSEAGSTAIQAENTSGQFLAENASRQTEQHQRQASAEHELTREALRYWWQ